MEELTLCNKQVKRSGLPCLRIEHHVGPCADDVSFKYRPETQTIWSHWYQHSSPKAAAHQRYKKQVWFGPWDQSQGGTLEAARNWFKANLPKPGPGYELHVMKSQEYPHGYFGPGWLKWVHKMDRHDKDLAALVTTWTNEQWEEFKRQEDSRRSITRVEF